MTEKREAALSKHIERLEKDIAERARGRREVLIEAGVHPLAAGRAICRSGYHLALDRDDLKKIALLREGVVPKLSDLPVGEISGMNSLPETDMFEFDDLKE